MSKLGRRLSAVVLFAFLASLMVTGVAFADGTVTDPDETETREGFTRYDFGSSATNIGDPNVTVFAQTAFNSPEAPDGWEYAGNSMTFETLDGGIFFSEPIVMCFRVPAGFTDVVIYHLNAFGAWVPVPTIQVDGGYCTMGMQIGTYAPMSPN